MKVRSRNVIWKEIDDLWLLLKRLSSQEGFFNRAIAGQQTLDAMTTPNGVVATAVALTTMASGIFEGAISIPYTLSGADTVTIQLLACSGITSVSGGTAEGSATPQGQQWHYAIGSPVVVTGGSLNVVAEWKASQVANELIATAVIPFMFQLPKTGLNGFLVNVTVAGSNNFTSDGLCNCYVRELEA